MPSGYEQEPDYGGRPPIDPKRNWPILLSILLAVFVALALKTPW
jgi:hypothetical protein